MKLRSEKARYLFLAICLCLVSQTSQAGVCAYLRKTFESILDPRREFLKAINEHSRDNVVGSPLTSEQAIAVQSALATSLTKYGNVRQPPRPEDRGFGVSKEQVYFAQSRGPEVQIETVQKYFEKGYGVEPIVIEFPLETGKFAYLVYEGNHRIVADVLHGFDRVDAEIWTIAAAKSKGVTEETLKTLIRSASKHMVLKP